MLNKDNRAIVADGGLHQTLDVFRRVGKNYLQPRHMSKPRVEATRMMWAGTTNGAHCCANYQRNSDPSVRCVMNSCRLLHDLSHSFHNHVEENEIDDRPCP